MKRFVVCDLDDCLIKTDLLYEHWLVLIKSRPLIALLSPFWLLRGKAYFKSKLASLTFVEATSIPYRACVLEYIKRKKAEGPCTLILASASPLPWVNNIANHLGFFDHTLGSTPDINLNGKAKLAAIQKLIGTEKFTYIADHMVDLPIWKESSSVVTVNAKKALIDEVSSFDKPQEHLTDSAKSIVKIIFKQLRPHQWIKNVLVFLPAVAGHKIGLPEQIIAGLLAFGGFSLAASFVYVFNDLLDLKSDRNHHSKKNRPFASGDLPVKYGLLILPLLILGTILFAVQLPAGFAFWISMYLLLNLAYTLHLKQSVVVDIIILSLMYTLRIFAGSAATDVPISEWLLSFSTLFFFSLACVKRYTEIIRSKNKLTLDGRGYRQVDGGMVQALGVGSGLVSVLIILLYLQSADIRSLYQNPKHLWFATPILLFWVSRIWILTNRDEINDDPVVFAVKDKASWACLALLVIVFGAAT